MAGESLGSSSAGPSRFERFLVAALAILALAAAAGEGWRHRTVATQDELIAAARAGYEALWRRIDALSQRAAAEDLTSLPREERFRRLARLVASQSDFDWSIYYVDPQGRIDAWAGAGLLHELDRFSLPRAGRTSRASLTASSLLSVVPIAGNAGRVVAGVSLSSETLPFALPGGAERGTRWSAIPFGGAVPGGRAAVVVSETPTLLLDTGSLGGDRRPDWRLPMAFGALLLCAIGSGRRRRYPALAALALGGGIGLLSIALAVSPWIAVAVGLTAGLLAWLATRRRSDPGDRDGFQGVFRRVAGPVRGSVTVLATTALAGWITRSGNPDLGESFLISPDAWAQRVLLLLLTFLVWELLAALGVRASSTSSQESRLWWAAGLLVAAAAIVDLTVLVLGLALTAGILAASGLSAVSLRGRPLLTAGVTLLAALLSATVHETMFRWQLRHDLAGPTLDALAPPTRNETVELQDRLREHFHRLDLADLSAGSIREMDLSDLAFETWRRSPLARQRAVSAITLAGDGGEGSSFSFGIPLDDGGTPTVQSRERPFDRPVWDHALVTDRLPILLEDREWGTLEYWLLVRPGHRLASGPIEDVGRDLLRGGPSGRGAVQEILSPAAYALYGSPDDPRISPWTDPPPLERAALSDGRGRLEHDETWWWFWSATEPDGYRLALLPRATPIEGLTRVATQAAGAWLPLALLTLANLLLRLSRRAFRDRARLLWRSYSRRLVLVFSLLVIVPAVLVDLVVLRALEERLAGEKLAEGRRALASARQVVSEYAAAREPGSEFATDLDNSLMAWLAGVLRHDVNLYWTGNDVVIASSRPELFATGILPRRVPGAVYDALKLRGRRSASRLQQAGSTRYTELYAPVTLPGEEAGGAQFLISVPLMAQEEAVAGEVARLRRQILLATAALVLLLVALGTRLATRFTRPLEEIVDGTQRIAAGATRLDLAPDALELATLVQAIDRMAQHIAEGRSRLLAEKAVVERMVDNITAAVVSLDGEGRVLMQNAVAAELLGTSVGEAIEVALARREALAGLPDALAKARDRRKPQTLTLPAIGDEEPREWTIVWADVPGEGSPVALVVVEDVTEVIRGERLEAWAEMARMIAHEIKNPLTPIRLSAEHLREVRQRNPKNFDEVFERCTTNILRHVEELRAISSEFSTYSRIPRIEPGHGDLVAAVRSLVDGYSTSPPAGVEVLFESAEESLECEFDPKLLQRALRNLLENALRAVADGGRVTVAVERGEHAIVTVRDDGPGVQAGALARIFDPYFSTHDTGTGLGLPIARRIIEEHGGEISARNRSEGGLEVRVRLPLASARAGRADPLR